MTEDTSDQTRLSFRTLKLGMPRDTILTADLGLCAGPIQIRYDADNRLTVAVDDGWTIEGAAAEFVRALAPFSGSHAPEWFPIASAPVDGTTVEVYAPPANGLRELVTLASYHPDAGWTVCEFREVTHWRPFVRPEQQP